MELLTLNEFASLKLLAAETLVDSLFFFALLALSLAALLADSLFFFASLALSLAALLADSLVDFASLALSLTALLVDSLTDFASLALSLTALLVDSLRFVSSSDFFVISSESLWNSFRLSDADVLLAVESDALSDALFAVDSELEALFKLADSLVDLRVLAAALCLISVDVKSSRFL